MLTYLLGPMLSILPVRWRKLLPFTASLDWRRATTIGGLAESLGGIVALAYWYSYSMPLGFPAPWMPR